MMYCMQTVNHVKATHTHLAKPKRSSLNKYSDAWTDATVKCC